MKEIKANLYSCRHCDETGTCTSGKDGSSCGACVKHHELKGKQDYYGLSCGTCHGLGLAEPITERMNKRIKPILSVLIVFFTLVFTFFLGMTKSQYFTEFLAFAATLIGSVTAFYFSGKANASH